MADFGTSAADRRLPTASTALPRETRDAMGRCIADAIVAPLEALTREQRRRWNQTMTAEVRFSSGSLP